MVQEKLLKIQALAMEGEDEGGAEIVQVILVLAFAIGLGIGLFAVQAIINGQLATTGTNLNDFFNALTQNAQH